MFAPSLFSRTSRPTKAATVLLLALTMLGFQPSTRAEDAKPKPDPAQHSVFVPYDGKQPPNLEQAQRFYLDYQEFQRLWDLAKKARQPQRAPEEPDDGGLDVSLNAAQYRMTIFDEHLEVEAQFEVVSHAKAWAKWSLPFNLQEIAVSSAEMDGKAIAFDNANLLIPNPGAHRVTLNFQIKRPKNWREAQLPIPTCPAALLTIAVPPTDGAPQVATVDNSWIVEANSAAPGANGAYREYTLPLSDLAFITLTRTVARLKEDTAPPATLSTNTTLSVGPQLERLHAQFQFGFTGVARDRFTIELEDQVRILSWNIPDLKSLSVRKTDGRLLLDIFLERPQVDQYSLTLQAERLWNGPAPRRSFPLLTGAARSRSTVWDVETTRDLDARINPTEGLDRVSSSANATAPWVSVGAWRMGNLAEQPSYTVTAAGNRSSAKIETVYQLTRQKAEIIATLDLEAGHGSIEEVRVGIPSGYDVETVAGPAVRGWNRETDQLMVHLTNGENPTAKLAIHLAHTAPQPVEQWTLSPLRLPAFEKVQSQVLVAVHVADEVKLSFDSNDRQMHEVDPASLTTSLSVTPPFSFKRALKIQKQDWTAQVSLHRSPPRFAADAVLLAQATDSGLKISQLLSVLVEQGGLDRVKVRLPKDLPEARVQGPLVRDAQSRIVGAVREYDISFQTEVLQDTSLAMDFELPLDGQKTLPVVQVPAADRLRTFIVTDNVSELEMRTEVSAVDPAIASSLPYVHDNLQRPTFYQARPESQVKISLIQLQSTAANAAIVTLADITTDLRSDGERWNTVVYSLANRSLQFLPVRLPSTAELVEVRVGDQNVRADLGKSPPEFTLYLVPLIQMRAGELSQQVRLVYRLPASRGKKYKLDQPELEGFTVERTLWHVHTPPGMRLKQRDGNMEEVPEAVITDEKNLQKLSDAGRLNRLLSSGKVNEQDAKEAIYNAGKAIDEVQKSRKENPMSRGAQVESNKRGQAQAAQSNEELERQIEQQTKIYRANSVSQQSQAIRKAVPFNPSNHDNNLTITKTGVGSWSFQQSGQLQLSGANTYNGGTVIHAGTPNLTAVNDNVVVGSNFFGANPNAIANNGAGNFTNNARASYANSSANPQTANPQSVTNPFATQPVLQPVWPMPQQAYQNSFTAQAAHAIQQGDEYANQQRWDAAQQSYQFAFNSPMPQVEVANEIRAAAREHFNNVNTRKAMEMADTGNYDSARALLKQVLGESPQDQKALALQKQLNEPERLNPALTPEHFTQAGLGNLTLNKTGGGTLTLNGASSYINGAIGPQNQSLVEQGNAITFSGAISNNLTGATGSLKAGKGNIVIDGGGVVNITGNTPLQVGQAVAGTEIPVSGVITATSGTTFKSDNLGGNTAGGTFNYSTSQPPNAASPAPQGNTVTSINGGAITFGGTSSASSVLDINGSGNTLVSSSTAGVVLGTGAVTPQKDLQTSGGILSSSTATPTITGNGAISSNQSNFYATNATIGGYAVVPLSPTTGTGTAVGGATGFATKIPAPPPPATPVQEPTLTPEHVKNAADVRRHMELGRANYELGLLDESIAEYENVLRIDPYNKPARQQMEKVEQEKSRYSEVAHNHTRAKFLRMVDAGWEDSVPGGKTSLGVASSQLNPAGRISLAVEVPKQEGEVYHFRKLKDHAELDLTLERPWTDMQWQNLKVLGWGILILAVIEAVRRLWRRRSRGSKLATA